MEDRPDPFDSACECDRACGGQPSRRSVDIPIAGADFDLRYYVEDHRGQMDRRDLVKVLATIGGLTAVGSFAAPLLSLTPVFEREYTGPVYSDGVPLVDADGERIEEDRLEMGDLLTVFPETNPGIEQAPTLLVRLPAEDYGGETNVEATVSGYAAYSKVCTHAGCMVSNVEDTTFVCPCHFGKFDPAEGAVVVGGPPPRPLPQLPIDLSADGYLIATGDFEATVGVAEG